MSVKATNVNMLVSPRSVVIRSPPIQQLLRCFSSVDRLSLSSATPGTQSRSTLAARPRPPVYGSGSWLLLEGLEPLCFARFGTRQAFHAPEGRGGSSCTGPDTQRGSLSKKDPYLSTSINLLLRHRTTHINPHFTLQPHTHTQMWVMYTDGAHTHTRQTHTVHIQHANTRVYHKFCMLYTLHVSLLKSGACYQQRYINMLPERHRKTHKMW